MECAIERAEDGYRLLVSHDGDIQVDERHAAIETARWGLASISLLPLCYPAANRVRSSDAGRPLYWGGAEKRKAYPDDASVPPVTRTCHGG